MRRLLRWTITCSSLLTMLASLAVVWLWWRSYRGHHDQYSLRLGGQRIVLRSESGRVTAWELPSEQGPARAQLRAWITRTQNVDLVWSGMALAEDDPRASGVGPILYSGARTQYRSHSWSAPLFLGGQPPPDGCLRPLLDALEDPERFAAAHAMLSTVTDWQRWPKTRSHGIYRDASRHQIIADFDNMRFELPPDTGWNADPLFAAVYTGPAARYEQLQVPKLRDLWFNRLAQPARSCPWWPFPLLLAVPMLFWLALCAGRAMARRRRHRRGCCRACGYDLRATTGRCPECGLAADVR